MRNNAFDVGWQRMFNPKGWFSFLVAMLGIGFLHDSFYTLLHTALSRDGDALKNEHSATWAMLLLGFGMLMLGAFFLRKRFVSLEPSPTSTFTQSPNPRKGLILLVSNETACRTAIEFHRRSLKYLWMFTTQEKRAIAETLNEELLEGCESRILLINTFEDPIEYHDHILTLYRHLPSELSVDDVILDFTGLSKSGSVGSVLAALEVDAPMQYTPQIAQNQSGMPIQIVIKETIESRKRIEQKEVAV